MSAKHETTKDANRSDTNGVNFREVWARKSTAQANLEREKTKLGAFEVNTLTQGPGNTGKSARLGQITPTNKNQYKATQKSTNLPPPHQNTIFVAVLAS